MDLIEHIRPTSFMNNLCNDNAYGFVVIVWYVYVDLEQQRSDD